jgi:hypothetical protein
LTLPLLCWDCEKKFSKAETYFSNNFFYPYLNENQQEYNYDEHLYYFLISILWRVLTLNIELVEQIDKKEAKFFEEVEEEWRLFLVQGKDIAIKSSIHLFFTNLIKNDFFPDNFNRYLTRNTDGCIVRADKKGIYSKFAKFIIYANLDEVNTPFWNNALVNNGKGEIKVTEFMGDKDLLELLIYRAKEALSILENELSSEQKKAIHEWTFSNLKEYINTDLAKSMEADLEDVNSTFLEYSKVRDKLCSCGSGKKTKDCHGF